MRLCCAQILRHAPKPSMSDSALARWQRRLGFTDRQAAESIFLARSRYGLYKQGVPALGPVLGLVCAAVEAGLSVDVPEDWSMTEKRAAVAWEARKKGLKPIQ